MFLLIIPENPGRVGYAGESHFLVGRVAPASWLWLLETVYYGIKLSSFFINNTHVYRHVWMGAASKA